MLMTLNYIFSPHSEKNSFKELQSCLGNIQSWMTANKLKLNSDKTEFIVFGSAKQRAALSNCFPVDILGTDLHPADKVRNLGVVFDCNFSFAQHVSAVCKNCYVNLRDFRRIRRYLPRDVAVTVANALISSRLDYCNSLFRSLSTRNLHRLQCLQKTAARIVTNTSKRSHITPVLRDLHWLPVRFRSQFKTLCIVHKYLFTGLPTYFQHSLVRYSCSVNTRRSEGTKLYLTKPAFDHRIHKSKTHFDNSFDVDAPGLWNDLPCHVRVSESHLIFRSRLKTFLFHKAYPP